MFFLGKRAEGEGGGTRRGDHCWVERFCSFRFQKRVVHSRISGRLYSIERGERRTLELALVPGRKGERERWLVGRVRNGDGKVRV